MALLEELRRADRLQATVLADLEAGRPSRAERRALRVLDTLDRLPVSLDVDQLRVRSLLSLASARADLRTVDDGLQVLVLAAAVVARTGDRAMQAMWDQQHGWLMLGAGRPRDALFSFNAAAAELSRLSPHNQCSVLNGRAFVHADLHDVRSARADWAECARRATEAGLVEVHCKGLHNLAWAEFLAGDLPTALSQMAQAAEMDVNVERGILTMDRARVLTEAGLVAEADRALAQAEAEFAHNRISYERALAEVARAECALLAGQPKRAEEFAVRAARRLRRRGSDGMARAADLVALQARARVRDRRERLADRVLSLRARFTANGQEVHARLAGLLAAELLVDEGRLGEARLLLSRDVRIRPSDRIGHRLQSRVAATKLALAENDRAAARRSIRRGIDELARHQAIFASLDLRTAAAVHGRRLAGLDLDMALADGRPDAIFDAGERARSLSSRLPPIRPPGDDHTATLIGELRAIVEQGRESAGAELTELAHRRVVLESRITELSWSRSGDSGATVIRPSRARDVREQLSGTDTAMVAYVRSNANLFAVVLDASRSRVVELGRAASVRERISRVRADLDVMAGQALSGGLRASVSAALANDLDRLDELAVRPLELGGKRIVVVAGGAVSTVPWGNVPSLRGVPTSIAPSATWWSLSAQVSPRPVSSTTAVVALSGPALDRAGPEADDIAGIWPLGHAVTAERATAAALSEALQTADVVHVAAHGRHEPQNPLFSSVRMSDGSVYAHEFASGSIRASQVVLSACDVGSVTVRPGDEALGLTSVLLAAGARTVVASVSRIADDVAHQAMVGYHRALVDGIGPADAVARMVGSSELPAPLVCFGVG